MMEVPAILKNAAEKSRLDRARYVDKNTPTSVSQISIVPFFPDVRSSMVLSSLLLKRYREEAKGSRYFIACSYPGFGPLFPYVDEYWSIKPEALKSMMAGAQGFQNYSDGAIAIQRSLNYFFEDLISIDELNKFYHDGLKEDFFERFHHVKTFLPAVSSSVVLGNEFNRELNKRQGNKVFIYPVMDIIGWKNGRTRSVKAPLEFWHYLIRRLLQEGYVPVVYQTPLTYDLSAEFTDSCMYVTDLDVGNVLAAMRATGCVLDVFSNISRIALVARCPFVACDERNRYSGVKEYEIDDLCGIGVPREYIFSFVTIIESGDKSVWNSNLLDSIIVRLDSIFGDMDRDQWPTTSESNNIVPYDKVRKTKSKKLGTKFIKVPRI